MRHVGMQPLNPYILGWKSVGINVEWRISLKAGLF